MSERVNELPANATWEEFGGAGAPAHFYHATGFTAGVYRPLLSRLGQKRRISALNLRATWPGIGEPPKARDYWQRYADDLISFIEREWEEPVIGIGHSLGATCTVLAADKRPDLFKSLVLIEPAMVSRAQARLIRLLPKAVLALTEPAKSTLGKLDAWPSREMFAEYCRQVRAYKRFGDEAFLALAQSGVVDNGSGQFQLSYPKRWEADVYTQPPNIMEQLARLKVPSVAIRGKPSVFFTEALWREWQQRCSTTVFKESLASGHLLPLEAPDVCTDLIEAGLDELSRTR